MLVYYAKKKRKKQVWLYSCTINGKIFSSNTWNSLKKSGRAWRNRYCKSMYSILIAAQVSLHFHSLPTRSIRIQHLSFVRWPLLFISEKNTIFSRRIHMKVPSGGKLFCHRCQLLWPPLRHQEKPKICLWICVCAFK